MNSGGHEERSNAPASSWHCSSLTGLYWYHCLPYLLGGELYCQLGCILCCWILGRYFVDWPGGCLEPISWFFFFFLTSLNVFVLDCYNWMLRLIKKKLLDLIFLFHPQYKTIARMGDGGRWPHQPRPYSLTHPLYSMPFFDFWSHQRNLTS